MIHKSRTLSNSQMHHTDPYTSATTETARAHKNKTKMRGRGAGVPDSPTKSNICYCASGNFSNAVGQLTPFVPLPYFSYGLVSSSLSASKPQCSPFQNTAIFPFKHINSLPCPRLLPSPLGQAKNKTVQKTLLFVLIYFLFLLSLRFEVDTPATRRRLRGPAPRAFLERPGPMILYGSPHVRARPDSPLAPVSR